MIFAVHALVAVGRALLWHPSGCCQRFDGCLRIAACLVLRAVRRRRRW